MLIPTTATATATVHDSAVAYQVKLKLECSINLRARERQPALFPQGDDRREMWERGESGWLARFIHS